MDCCIGAFSNWQYMHAASSTQPYAAGFLHASHALAGMYVYCVEFD
jgi:hypothetical protein